MNEFKTPKINNPNKMKNFNGKVAVITGAGSGIGRALCLQLSDLGVKIVAADFNKITLTETAEMIIQKGGEVFQQVVDVSKKEEVYAMKDAVLEKYGAADIVINNAGVGLGTLTVEEVTLEEIEWIFGINLWGVIYGTKAFLPHLKIRPEAAIVNISSVFGLIGVNNQSPYCMTKFAVRGLTESLRAEMLDSNVLVMQVHPGGIDTNIVRNSRQREEVTEAETNTLISNFKQNARTTPEKAAKIIIKGLQKNKVRVLVGPDACVFDWMTRFFPNWANRLFAKMSRNFEEKGKFF